MRLVCVEPRFFARREAVRDVTPVLGTGICGINAEGFDGIDCAMDLLDFRPAGYAQQDFAAGPHERNCREGLTVRDGAQDIDPRKYGAVAVRSPAYERKDASRREAKDALAPVENVFVSIPAKADPAFGLAFIVQEVDIRESWSSARSQVSTMPLRGWCRREIRDGSVASKHSLMTADMRTQGVVVTPRIGPPCVVVPAALKTPDRQYAVFGHDFGADRSHVSSSVDRRQVAP